MFWFLVDIKKLLAHSITPNYRSRRLNSNLRFFLLSRPRGLSSSPVPPCYIRPYSPMRRMKWCNGHESYVTKDDSFSSHERQHEVMTSSHRSCKRDNIFHSATFVPRHNLSFGSWAFRVSAAKFWNTLPLHIRQSQSLSTFRCHLNAHYFQLAYPAT